MKLHTYGGCAIRSGWRRRWRACARSGGCATATQKTPAGAVQHMQKALTKMNIQLANVISDITGGQRSDDHWCDPKKRARPLETGGSETRDGASSWRDLIVP